MIHFTDRQAGALRCMGKDLFLGGVAAAIVDRLLNAPGRAVPTESLIQSVYGGSRQPENPENVIKVTICKLRAMGVPIKSRGRGSFDGYWLEANDIGLLPGNRFTLDGCPGEFRVKEIIQSPVVVFHSLALGMEVSKTTSDPVFRTLKPAH